MSLLQNTVTWAKTNYNKGCSIPLAVIVYIVAIVVLVILVRSKFMDKYVNRCVIGVNSDDREVSMWDKYIDMIRGNEYFIAKAGDDEEKRKELKSVASKCPVTVWPILHFFLYAVLGFLMPKFFWHFFVIGILWEMMEWFAQCHCVLDIAWNFGGLLLGVALRQRFLPYIA